MKAQFVALLVSRGAGALLLAISFVLVARWAGPSDFGILSAILAVGAVYFVIVDLGLSSFISRASAKGHLGDVATALRLNTISSVLGGVVAAGAITLFAAGQQLPAGLLVLGLSMALEKNVDTALAVSIARGNKTTPAVSILVRRALTLGLLAALYAAGTDPILAYAYATLASSLVGQFLARRALADDYRYTGQRTPSLWRAAFPFLLANLTASSRNLDILIVTTTSGSQMAGLYAAAQRLTSPFMLIPSTIATLVLPAGAKGTPRRAARIAWKLTGIHLGLLALLMGVAVFADPLVRLLLGTDFAASAPILAWTLAAFPFIALASPLGGLLQSQGHERVVATNGIVFSIVLIVALIIGSLLFGGVGAAQALTAVYVAKSVSLLAIIRVRLR
ncbi:oligosaccharide flippase family protein [Planctomonas psychrotolerans]|uniref:oligosaccharide flippase family protein n=1 Tax=Planctomonas psychrotolerans TaxID=2528712 RepID=UPI001D0D5605|nr:oligosaccharide flippase family protein [Planctomonas psychrotolerans]